MSSFLIWASFPGGSTLPHLLLLHHHVLLRRSHQDLSARPRTHSCRTVERFSSRCHRNAFASHIGADSRLSATGTHSCHTVEQILVSVPRERARVAHWTRFSSQCHRNAFVSHSGADSRLSASGTRSRRTVEQVLKMFTGAQSVASATAAPKRQLGVLRRLKRHGYRVHRCSARGVCICSANDSGSSRAKCLRTLPGRLALLA